MLRFVRGISLGGYTPFRILFQVFTNLKWGPMLRF